MQRDYWNRLNKDLHSRGFSRIAGVDEVGRGPLAGPVVAAACILPAALALPGLTDSKQLSAQQRETLYLILSLHPEVIWSVAFVSAEEIDQINILQATLLAMKKAVLGLAVVPDYVLVDGNRLPSWDIPSQAIVKGDSLCPNISAASILAKVTRDRWMSLQDQIFTGYGFKDHKGYGTKRHVQAIQELGMCPLHRRSFSIHKMESQQV